MTKRAVLIIDDDPIHVEVTRRLLEMTCGAIVSAAPNGTSARVHIDRQSFDLLVLDLNMPDYDGIEFLRHLREIGYSGAIVIASGADRSLRQAADRLGKAYGLNVAGVVEKPISLQNLVPAMAHL